MSDDHTSSADLVLPRSDEPPDFRRQARAYTRFRRDYSGPLYDAIAAATGPAAGRRALDLGCGTGFVSGSLRERGWRVVGSDFSQPMLAEAQAFLAPSSQLVRARAEALALRDASVALVTCGTAFHWFAPRPALDEIARVLAPGGIAALFWRYPAADAPTPALIRDVLRRFGPDIPGQQVFVHPPEPFLKSTLQPLAAPVLHGTLHYTPAEFHGYAATTEFLRRFAGEHHAAFLDALREELVQRYPNGIDEPSDEHLFLARRP
ncbi:methyltransferase domain-containing protein [Candidatus Binatia bacterium]|nr:methyltransferase domain-containing protein [Candidatus Binatia bacterium]